MKPQRTNPATCRGPGFRRRLLLFAVAAVGLLHGQSAAPVPEPLRIGLVATDTGAEPLRTGLVRVLARDLGVAVELTPAPRQSDGRLSLAPLRSAHVAVVVRGPGPLGAADVAALQQFLAAGKGTVVLAAAADAWPAAPALLPEILGATPGGHFARGAPMTVINLFPHPIHAGMTTFETRQPMALWQKLADDCQLIMEGTVGEETTPLAWVRRREAGRLCHFVPADPALFSDDAYLHLVANAILWSAGRPNPLARPEVQRTFMPESHPGSFAITFPGGPGVCFDPVRGGINFVWDGDFVDLRPRWITKQGEPARIFGKVFYRETAWQPLRGGSPTRAPEFHFRGYALGARGPEFHYEVNGRDIFETIEASAAGSGLTRRFRVGPGSGPLWIALEPQTDAEIRLTGLTRDGNQATFASASAGEFTLEIRRHAGGLPP